VALRLGAIVEALGGELQGDPGLSIERLSPLAAAEGDAIAFLSHPKYQKELAASRAACVIVAPAMREAAAARGAFIETPEPYLYFARLTQLWK
jgi:UDP-3-O-[3-hydroxymyristoyl] glucosamine N-acyltransferase